MYEAKLREVNNYEKTMSTRIMSLSNEIAELTTKCDEVEAEKSALQNSEEETSAKKWDQISELSQVIFAIEMIENLCSKKTDFHTTTLPYANSSVPQKSFDSFGQCEQTSLKQLDHIGHYMNDFKAILGHFKQAKPNARPNAVVVEEDSEDEY